MAPGIKFSLGNLIANTEINHLLSPRESSSCDFFCFLFLPEAVCVCVCVVCHQDELLAELDELQQEEVERSLLEIGGSENVNLPNVPSTSLPSRGGKSLAASLPLPVHLWLWGRWFIFYIFLSCDVLQRVSGRASWSILVYIPSKKGVTFS